MNDPTVFRLNDSHLIKQVFTPEVIGREERRMRRRKQKKKKGGEKASKGFGK